MDPATAIAVAFGIIQGGIKLVEQAQAAGKLGGSTDWLPLAQSLAAMTGNFAEWLEEGARDPKFYDTLTDNQIRQRISPEGWAEKEARIRRELAGGGALA